jgi:hypothetical protein
MLRRLLQALSSSIHSENSYFGKNSSIQAMERTNKYYNCITHLRPPSQACWGRGKKPRTERCDGDRRAQSYRDFWVAMSRRVPQALSAMRARLQIFSPTNGNIKKGWSTPPAGHASHSTRSNWICYFTRRKFTFQCRVKSCRYGSGRDPRVRGYDV